MDKIIPFIIATITQHRRYKVPDLKFPQKSITGKMFRLWELIAWRRAGIRIESRTTRYEDGTVDFQAYSFEAKVTHFEEEVREYLRRLKGEIKSKRVSFENAVGDIFGLFKAPVVAFAGFPNITFNKDHISFAIAFNAATSNFVASGYTADGGSGSNRFMTFTGCCDTSDNLTAVTWNSESMSKDFTQYSATTTRYNYIWHCYPVGTGNASLSLTGMSDSSVTSVLVYTGVKATGQPKNATGTTGGAATSGSVSITANDGDWLFGGAGNVASNTAASTNTIRRGLESSQTQGDSNGAASPTALNWTWSSSAWYAYGAAIEPYVAAGPVNMKTWDGLASASVKTMDGLAIASVKTWNGLA